MGLTGRLAAAALVLVLAGCAAPAPSDAPPAGAPTHLVIVDVYDVESAVPIPIDVARSYAPKGFEATPFAADPSGAHGVLAVVTLRFEAANTTSTFGGGSVMFVLVPVMPPEALVHPEANVHGALVAVLTDVPGVAQTFRAWGVHVLDAEVDQQGSVSGVLRQGFAEARATGATIRADASGPEEQRERPEEVPARLFVAADGRAVGAIDLWTTPHSAVRSAARLAIDAEDAVLRPLSMRMAAGIGTHAFGVDTRTTFDHVSLL